MTNEYTAKSSTVQQAIGEHPAGGRICLGPRLRMAADLAADLMAEVRTLPVLADIGSDHAYLPAYLLQQGIIERAIAADLHRGPFQNILRTRSLYGLEEKMSARQGDGLAVLKPEETETLALTGMGGTTILEILEAHPAVAATIFNLILQPQGAEGLVRRRLLEQGWFLYREALVQEGKELYAVLALTRADQECPAEEGAAKRVGMGYSEARVLIEGWEAELGMTTDKVFAQICWDLGPMNIIRRDPLLDELILAALVRLDAADAGMSHSSRIEVARKRSQIRMEKHVWKGVQTWLHQ